MYWRFWVKEKLTASQIPRSKNLPPADIESPAEFSDHARKMAGNLTHEGRTWLASELGLPVEAVNALEFLGWREGKVGLPEGWTVPERDHRGRIVGTHLRRPKSTSAGKGKMHDVGGRGLTIPNGWEQRTGPILLVEGMSDVLAAHHAGLCAIGRFSNRGGVDFLAKLLCQQPPEREIIFVGENDLTDQKEGDAYHWPGRIGAYASATKLARQLGRAVKWAMVPSASVIEGEGTKDTRDWFRDRNPSTLAEWQDAGRAYLAAITLNVRAAEPGILYHPQPACGESLCHKQIKGDDAAIMGRKVPGADCHDRVVAYTIRTCKSWSCEACRRDQINRLQAWLCRCIGEWADAERLPEGTPRIERGAYTDADGWEHTGRLDPPDFGDYGPWDLYGGLFDVKTCLAVKRFAQRAKFNYRPQCQWACIKVRPHETMGEQTAALQNLLGGKVAEDSQALIVAIDPRAANNVHSKLRRIDPDQATRAVELAAALIPFHADEPTRAGKKPRLTPDGTSEGWQQPAVAQSGNGCKRLARDRFTMTQRKDALAGLGIYASSSELDSDRVMDSTTWCGFLRGVAVAEAFELASKAADREQRKPDPADVVRIGKPWVDWLVVNHFPEGERTREQLKRLMALDRPPSPDDYDTLRRAAREDDPKSIKADHPDINFDDPGNDTVTSSPSPKPIRKRARNLKDDPTRSKEWRKAKRTIGE